MPVVKTRLYEELVRPAMSMDAPNLGGARGAAMTAGKRRGSIASLDLVRVVSMGYVVGFWHLMNYVGGYGGYRNEITSRITVIVLATFTMLSGYLLGRTPLEPSWSSVGRFYRRRLLRVYPPLVIALLVFAALGITSWSIAAKSSLLLSLFSGPSAPTIWYVCMLALFYLLAPILLVDRRASAQGVPGIELMVAGGLLWLGALALLRSGLLAMEPRLVLYFPCFVVGIALARRDGASLRVLAFVGLFALLGCAASYGLPLTNIETSLRSVGMATFSAAFIMLVALRAEHRFPSYRAVSVLSYAAFFMYLAHRPIYKMVTAAVSLPTPAARIAFMIIVALPCVIAVSWLGQSLYDRIVRQLET